MFGNVKQNICVLGKCEKKVQIFKGNVKHGKDMSDDVIHVI